MTSTASRFLHLALAPVLLAAAPALSPTRAQAQVAFRLMPPELTGGPWINTSRGEPVRLGSLRGKVTIVHFWTYG